MDNQHRKIQGYRELSQTEIDLMNKIKSKGAELGELYDELNALANEQQGHATTTEEGMAVNEMRRWLALGKTHLQQGLMALTRAVAKPTFF